MDARLDSAFESWGMFGETPQQLQVPGRLTYDPADRIALELVENKTGEAAATVIGLPEVPVIYGRLIDGTLVTLYECITTKTSVGAGAIGLPTALSAMRAIFGGHVADIDQLPVTSYTIELSSLSQWTGMRSPRCDVGANGGCVLVHYVQPDPIVVRLVNEPFDLQVYHGFNVPQAGNYVSVRWHAGLRIAAHEQLPLCDAREVASQGQQLMSLLIGHQITARSVAIKMRDERDTGLRMIFAQHGKSRDQDIFAAEMLLPYELVKSQFPEIVAAWFARSNQAILAANVYFAAQLLESSLVNVKFLAASQAAESYHRALGTGLYMDQAMFDKAVAELETRIPASIESDHRQSLKNKMKYGNEFSLRKRLHALFDRISNEVAERIAGNIQQFVGKVVDTRNYFTHYDHESKASAFSAKEAYVAAERLRVLIVANFLHDLGIVDDKLVRVLERSGEFSHW